MDLVLQKLISYYHSFLKALPRLGLAVALLIIGILCANWITSLVRKRIDKKSHDSIMSGFLAKQLSLYL